MDSIAFMYKDAFLGNIMVPYASSYILHGSINNFVLQWTECINGYGDYLLNKQFTYIF